MPDNGHTNGQAVAEVVDSYLDRSNLRLNIRSLLDALDDWGAKGIDVPDKLVDALPIIAARLAQHPDERIVRYGGLLTQGMLNYNLKRVALAASILNPKQDHQTVVVQIDARTQRMTTDPEFARSVVAAARAIEERDIEERRRALAGSPPTNGHANGTSNGHNGSAHP